MKMTGHEDYESMKVYLEVSDDTVKSQMMKWENNPVKNKIRDLLSTASIEQMNLVLEILTSKSV